MFVNREKWLAPVVSSTGSASVSSTEKKKKKQPSRQKLFKIVWDLLNHDNMDEQALMDIANMDPRVFAMKYELRKGILAMPLTWICAKRPSFHLTKTIYEAWPDAISASMPLPLHYACKYGASILVVQYLHEQFPQAMKRIDDDGNLPIHHACNMNATQLLCGNTVDCDDNSASTSNSRKRNKKLKRVAAEMIKKDCIDEQRSNNNDDVAKVLRYLISKYPTGARTRNKDGNMPLHLLCQSFVDFETAFIILSTYPQAVNVINDKGQLPEELLDKNKNKNPPDHVLELFQYVQTNLDDPFKQYGLPPSRYALEWDLFQRELVQEYASTSTQMHVIQAGILAKQQVACLCQLRQYYPSQKELQKIMEHNRELRLKYNLNERKAVWQNDQEIQDSETIPTHVQPRIEMLESQLDDLEKERLVGAPSFHKLQLFNAKAKLEIELHVEHAIYQKIFGKPPPPKQKQPSRSSSATVTTVEMSRGANTVSAMTAPDYYSGESSSSNEDAAAALRSDLYDDNLRLKVRTKKQRKKKLRHRSKASCPILFRCLQEENAHVDFGVCLPHLTMV